MKATSGEQYTANEILLKFYEEVTKNVTSSKMCYKCGKSIYNEIDNKLFCVCGNEIKEE